jgi:hypothetical protein
MNESQIVLATRGMIRNSTCMYVVAWRVVVQHVHNVLLLGIMRHARAQAMQIPHRICFAWNVRTWLCDGLIITCR